ncbi:MAG: polysaccharide biosynthesis C-terminal domain-containing protein [Chitinophagales bacterium]|nr:polysaccharide biosynthesis C-terminal domain-containing protein [Chitinophagales bacterium]MDW8418650.1 polysaccharide biosynthesis C-terminal domain-containing protein [Chitinophagales bacterium]
MGVVKRQSIKNTVSTYLGIVLGFISLLIIQPRFLKAEEIGLARVLFAFSSLVSMIIPLGINNVTVKYFSLFRNETRKHHGYLGLMLLVFGIGFLLCTTGLFLFKEFIIAQYRRQSPQFIEYYNYIIPFSFFLGLFNLLSAYLNTIYKSTVPSYLNDIWSRLGYIAVILLYWFGKLTLPQFVILYIGVYALQGLIALFYLLSVDKPSLHVDWTHLRKLPLREMFGFGLLLMAVNLASLGLKTLDAVFLGKFQALSAVGVYTIAAFIPTVIEAPLNAMDRITIAKYSQAYAAGNREEMRNIYYQSVRYMSVIAGYLLAGIVTNIVFLLKMIGKDYAGAYQVVYIIAAGSFVSMLGGSSVGLLVYTSRWWMGALILISVSLLHVVFNMTFIPHWGLNGAAMATALSSFVFTSLKFTYIYSKFRFQPIDFNIWKVIMITAVCIFSALLVPEVEPVWLNILMRGMLITFIYAGMLYYWRLVPALTDLRMKK